MLLLLGAFLASELAIDIYSVARPGIAATVVVVPSCFVSVWTQSLFVAQLVRTLVFDALVFALLLGRCLFLSRQQGPRPIFSMLMRDGARPPGPHSLPRVTEYVRQASGILSLCARATS